MMDKQDKALLKKLQDNPNNYEVIVGNDDVTVQKVNPYGCDEQEELHLDFDTEYESFSTFGQTLLWSFYKNWDLRQTTVNRKGEVI